MKSRAWICTIILCALPAATLNADNLARKEAVFPFFIQRESTEAGRVDLWGTGVWALNPHPSETEVLVTIFDATGNPVRTGSLRVPGFQSAGANLGRLGKDFTGWVKVAASQTVIFIQQINHYGGLVGDPTTILFLKSGVSLIPYMLTQRQFIEVFYKASINTNTGLAIVFPSEDKNSFTTGKLIFRWVDGRHVTEKTFTIGANQQLIGLFTELLPESRNFSTLDLASGSVEAVFDKPVGITAIQMTVSAASEELSEPPSGRVEIGQ